MYECHVTFDKIVINLNIKKEDYIYEFEKYYTRIIYNIRYHTSTGCYSF